jgi:hypothetical protein
VNAWSKKIIVRQPLDMLRVIDLYERNFMFLKQFMISLFACAMSLNTAYSKVVTRSAKPKHTIEKLYSYKDVAPILHQAQPDWLIIFDVDETLIKKDGLKKKIREKDYLWLDIKRPLTGSHSSVALARYRYVHIDDTIQTLLKAVWAKKLKPIALTHCSSGSSGVIKSKEKWRYQHLKELGLDFKKSYTDHVELIQKNNAVTKPPVFYNGIIYTNHHPKGYCLELFLEYTGLTPKQIIFFDDLIKNVESVRDSAIKYGINFVGYHVMIPTAAI